MMRMLTSLSATIAVAWLALCALLFLLQRQMLYLPQSTRVPAASTDFAL